MAVVIEVPDFADYLNVVVESSNANTHVKISLVVVLVVLVIPEPEIVVPDFDFRAHCIQVDIDMKERAKKQTVYLGLEFGPRKAIELDERGIVAGITGTTIEGEAPTQIERDSVGATHLHMTRVYCYTVDTAPMTTHLLSEKDWRMVKLVQNVFNFTQRTPMEISRARAANSAMQPQTAAQIGTGPGRPKTNDKKDAHKIKASLLQQFRARPTFVVPPAYNTIWDNKTGMPLAAVVNKGKSRHTAMSGLKNNFWQGMLTILGPGVLRYITPKFWSMGKEGEQFDFSLTWCDWKVTIPNDDAREVRQFFEAFLQWYADWPKNNDRLDNNIPIDNALMYVYIRERLMGNSKILHLLATPSQIKKGYNRLYPAGKGRIYDGLHGFPGYPAGRRPNNPSNNRLGRGP
ncbi:hypothetical protein DL98DRAFT_614657 [Cadophora sp. DSE1049]|nr:hypothetical protein DL98DRAFT_614657 [Cadophora sp. DSE1049]